MNMNYLLGVSDTATPLAHLLKKLCDAPAWQPFDTRAMEFVKRFSQKLLTAPSIRAHPELAALGHWFRGANLRKLAQKYPSQTDEAVLLGRGLAFHVAPSNVDSVFMYTGLLSLLAGNVNIVRISQKTSAAQSFLIKVLAETFAEDIAAHVSGRFVLLTYPHDDNITSALSEACQLRVLWGGDETVRKLRTIPLRPTASEMCFPDRFSACAINAEALLALDQSALLQLVTRFHNDAFWFGQQACSSPRLVAWVGEPSSIKMARKSFWAGVAKILEQRSSEDSEAMSMARLAACFEYAGAALAHPIDQVGLSPGYPLKLELEQTLNETVKEIHCGNGLFLETRISKLTELAYQFSGKEQTLAVYGFSREQLREFALVLPARSIDRIVNIGDALNFAPVWDGQDLITVFSRKLMLP